MALPVYVVDVAFGDAFQNFLDAGGYEIFVLPSAAVRRTPS